MGMTAVGLEMGRCEEVEELPSFGNLCRASQWWGCSSLCDPDLDVNQVSSIVRWPMADPCVWHQRSNHYKHKQVALERVI